ncbi:hypothetical protein HMPREF0620_1006 [Parascardovia denticolens DSM 10105 = JCM 12538]|uniref:Uncharacterized protein n=1 Tax=Parascardovia denticolens DSM 10105 = JCM 12538 TaxID=864564 RepID=E6JZB1_PARDN|nr:hypothetical protein HMPREF0620_1006 [Parascardovia denticolens DSM 10105 = JCM 12538]
MSVILSHGQGHDEMSLEAAGGWRLRPTHLIPVAYCNRSEAA